MPPLTLFKSQVTRRNCLGFLWITNNRECILTMINLSVQWAAWQPSTMDKQDLLSIRHSQAHICNIVCSLGLPGYSRSQEMVSHPARGLPRWLQGCCICHTGAVGRPGSTHPEKKKPSKLPVVAHNLMGTAQKVRPGF